MNSEELRNLAESYYYDVYDCGDLDEELTGSRLRRANRLIRQNPNTPKSERLKQVALSQHGSSLDTLNQKYKEGKIPVNPTDFKTETRDDHKKLYKMRNYPQSRGGISPKISSDGILDDPDGGRSRPGRETTSKIDASSVQKSIARHAKRKRPLAESYDLYDVVLEHLLAEGYADDTRSAEVIMANMSDEWLGDILSERRREDKGSPRRPRDPAFEYVLKQMGPGRGSSTRKARSRAGMNPPMNLPKRGEKKVRTGKVIPIKAGEPGSGRKSPQDLVKKKNHNPYPDNVYSRGPWGIGIRGYTSDD